MARVVREPNAASADMALTVRHGATAEGGATTRDRILDVALDLFLEQGVDRTSLREIADRMGFSKAAIYYHFSSKDDIVLALHMRLHAFGHRAIEQLSNAPAGLKSWAELLNQTVDELLTSRRIFLVHIANSAAFAHLHAGSAAHDEDHEDLERRIRALISDTSVPAHDRVRMACAVGALMAGLVASSDMLRDLPPEELGEILRGAVRDLLQRPAG